MNKVLSLVLTESDVNDKLKIIMVIILFLLSKA